MTTVLDRCVERDKEKVEIRWRSLLIITSYTERDPGQEALNV